MEAKRVFGRDCSDGFFHLLEVGSGEQFAPGTEDEPVLGIEAMHGDLGIEVAADGGEDLAQHAGIEEKSGADVEAIAGFGFHGGGATTGAVTLFDDGDTDTGFS
jgi:hypothetical protein